MIAHRTLTSPRTGAVRREDLERLDDLHALLFVLNDPAAAIDKIADLCTRLPALEQRLLAVAALSQLGGAGIGIETF